MCERMYAAVAAVFARAGADSTFGSQLPALLTELHLHEIGGEVHAPIVSGGIADGWVPLSVEHLLSRMLASGLLSEADARRIPEFFGDTNGRYLPPLMVTTWGRR
jgi:hypothetical protein